MTDNNNEIPRIPAKGLVRTMSLSDDIVVGETEVRAKVSFSDGSTFITNSTILNPSSANPGFVLPTTTTSTTTSTTTRVPGTDPLNLRSQPSKAPFTGFSSAAESDQECPCGTIVLPPGKAFDTKGMSVELVGKKDSKTVIRTVSLLHRQPAYVETQQKFISVTETIPVEDFDEITSAVIIINSDDEGPLLTNVISIKVKDFSTSEPFGHKILGLFGQSIRLYNSGTGRPQVNIPLHGSNLVSNFIVEFESLCDFYEPECCDALPRIAASGYTFLCLPLQSNFTFPIPTYDDLNRTTTTMTPIPPVEIRPVLPD